jgi:hypothetical protein
MFAKTSVEPLFPVYSILPGLGPVGWHAPHTVDRHYLSFFGHKQLFHQIHRLEPRVGSEKMSYEQLVKFFSDIAVYAPKNITTLKFEMKTTVFLRIVSYFLKVENVEIFIQFPHYGNFLLRNLIVAKETIQGRKLLAEIHNAKK